LSPETGLPAGQNKKRARSDTRHVPKEGYFIFGSLAILSQLEGRPMALRPRLSTGVPVSDVDKAEYISLVTGSKGKISSSDTEIYHIRGVRYHCAVKVTDMLGEAVLVVKEL
jgi:hypothetical protein